MGLSWSKGPGRPDPTRTRGRASRGRRRHLHRVVHQMVYTRASRVLQRLRGAYV